MRLNVLQGNDLLQMHCVLKSVEFLSDKKNINKSPSIATKQNPLLFPFLQNAIHYSNGDNLILHWLHPQLISIFIGGDNGGV
jgi:hypothetical protein